MPLIDWSATARNIIAKINVQNSMTLDPSSINPRLTGEFNV